MGEVIARLRLKKQQGSRRANDRGRRSRALNSDKEPRELRQQSWSSHQFRLRIRGENGTVSRHHRRHGSVSGHFWRHGVKAAPMFPVNKGGIGHMWISIFMVLFTSHGIQSSTTPEFGVLHQFTAYDCERPLSVEAFQLPSHCLDHKTDDDIIDPKTNLTLTDNQPYQLLQKATYHEFDAHVCKQSPS